MVEKYVGKEVEKMENSKYVDNDKDFHAGGSACFNHCHDKKIKCLGIAVESMLRYGSQVMNPQKIKFIQELILPYQKTVRKIGNPKVSIYEKRKLLHKAQVGQGVLESVNKFVSKRPNYPVGWEPSSRIR